MNTSFRLIAFIRRSVSRKILFFTSLLGSILLLALGSILTGHLDASLREENHLTMERIAETVGKGLQAIMLAGQAPIAQDYMNRLKEVSGLETLRIFRIDGSEAFQGTTTGNTLDPLFKEAFQQALRDKKELFLSTTGPDGAGRMTILSPLLNREPCHQCHGADHPIRGVFQLTLSQAASEAKLRTAKTLSLVAVAIAIPVLIGVILLVLRRIMQQPLSRLHRAIDRISGGDLTHHIDSPPEPLDEIGEIIQDINQMTTRFGTIIRQVFLQAHSMAACINDLMEVRNGLSDDSMRNVRLAEETARDHERVEQQVSAIREAIRLTSDQVGTISSATEHLSTNITTIASGAEQASCNINTMASAAEEITANIAGVNQSLSQVDDSVTQVASSIGVVTASLEQVRQRCQQAYQESHLANEKAQGTHATMDRLARSAREIDQVLGVINNIASQTNMLALNASIEAAGAGEAGRGFAVVANEVKALARQIGDATRMIAAKIQEIQGNTREVADANREITESIARLSQTNTDIVEAVDEQADSIGKIARSMNEVAQAAGEVTRNAQELNLAASDIARSALEAANGAVDVARSAGEASRSATTLAQQSERIHATAQNVSLSADEAAAATSSANQKVREIFHTSTLVNGAIHHTSLLIGSIAVPGRKLKASVQDLTVSPEPFAVEKIKGAHLKWLGKLENVIRGRSDLRPEQVASGRECDFGKWYYSEGSERFGTMPIFRQVGEIHLRVHEVARETVKQVADGHIAAAEKKMDEFSGIKDQLFDRMDELYLEAGK
ncbi:MAG: CZB domain-containing protein [Magnetococcales bacterium]|nr:CZB domain-containing protein [Magnetococcales bacterium]